MGFWSSRWDERTALVEYDFPYFHLNLSKTSAQQRARDETPLAWYLTCQHSGEWSFKIICLVSICNRLLRSYLAVLLSSRSALSVDGEH